MRKVIITVSSLAVLPLFSQAVSAQTSDSLKEKSIEEVVVVGYGTQQKSKVSGAVSDVKLTGLESRSAYSVGEALQGRTPGVTVISEGGDPNATPRVNVRGLGGFNGDKPLYVIDGSVYNGIPNLNPNDIESVSVLKDATASIYGALSSGGVILITTKRGSKGRMTVDFDSKYGFSNAWKKIRPLNAAQFQDVIALAYQNAGKDVPFAFDKNRFPQGRTDQTNWMNDVFQTGILQDYNVGISGGSDKSSIYIGLNYRTQSGTLLNTNSRRYNFHINSDNTITNWLKAGASFNYNFTNGNTADTGSAYSGAIISALYYPPSIPVYDANGNFSGLPADMAKYYGDIINPVAYLKRITYSTPLHSIVMNPNIEVNLLKGLTFRSNLSAQLDFLDTNNFQMRVPEIGKVNTNNLLTVTSSRRQQILAEQILKYSRKFGVHSLTATAGYSYIKNSEQRLFVEKQNFANESDYMQFLQNGSSFSSNLPSNSSVSAVMLSGFARIEYDYSGKYLLALNGRRDATSLLGEDYRTKNYGSVSAGWVISKENFFEGMNDWWNLFKIRGSYGLTGNLSNLSASQVSPPMNLTSAFFGTGTSVLVNGYAQDNFPNPELTWGNILQKDFGVDLGFFHNRLTINADYYDKLTRQMIFNEATPTFGGIYRNAGRVQDRGYEVGVNYSGRNSDRFSYNVYGNISSVADKVLDMYGTSYREPYTFRGTLNPVYDKIGYPMFSFFGLKTDGIFQNQQQIDSYVDANGAKIQPNAKPGDLKFLKAPGNTGTIDSQKDAQYLGSPYPKFSYSFGANFKYRNFDLDLFFQGTQGNKIFNAFKFTTLNAVGPAGAVNLDSRIYSAWSPTNPGGTIPRIVAGDPSANFSRASAFYVEDGSYLRLKSVTLGYSLPQELSDRVNLRKIRIYVTANNLLTFTKYTGMDPEVGLRMGGMDTGIYPNPRTFIFGVNLGL